MRSCCTSWEIKPPTVTTTFDVDPAVTGAVDTVLVGTNKPRNAIDEINPNRGIDRLLETMGASVANEPSVEGKHPCAQSAIIDIFSQKPLLSSPTNVEGDQLPLQSALQITAVHL